MKANSRRALVTEKDSPTVRPARAFSHQDWCVTDAGAGRCLRAALGDVWEQRAREQQPGSLVRGPDV